MTSAMPFVFDPDEGAMISAFGPKKFGKSHLCEAYFRAYPYDRLVIDPSGDVDVSHQFTVDAPAWPFRVWTEAGKRRCVFEGRWPEPADNAYPSIRYVVDQTDADWLLKVDTLVGYFSNLRHELGSDEGPYRPKCIWLDEVGEIALEGSRCPPRVNAMLHHLRHMKVTSLNAGPRPVGVNTLVLSNADLVAMFSVPHELDRDRLAGSLGVPRSELSPLLDNLDRHEYVAFLLDGRSVEINPPMPADLSEFDFHWPPPRDEPIEPR